MNSKKIIINFLWKFSGSGLSRIISVVISLILARLIAPEAYGILAISQVLINILYVFVDPGVGVALVQKKEADELDFSSVFYCNLAVCVGLYLVLFFTAPLVGKFYDSMEAVPIIRVISLVLVVAGIRSTLQAYVERALQFKKFFLSSLLATTISGAVGLIMAYAGFGVWALVAVSLVNVTVTTVVLWFSVKWRPKLQFSFVRLKPLVSYGSKVLGSALVSSVYTNSRQLLIGKFYTTSDLAFYTKGNSLPQSIVPTIQSSITSVLLPVISRCQDDIRQAKALTGKTVAALGVVLWPMMVGLAACAENFVHTILTDAWLPAVPYMQLFCVEAALWPISSIYANTLKALGHSGLDLKLQTIMRTTGFLMLLAIVWHSPFAVAICAFALTAIEVTVFIGVNKKVLGYGIAEQLKEIVPFAVMSFVMGAVVLLMGKMFANGPVLLILQVICGVLVYGAEVLIFKRDVIRDTITMLRSKSA